MNERLKKLFNLTWLRVKISYYIFNNLLELLNGDLATKIGRGIFSKDLMDINVIVLFHLKSTKNISKKVNADQDV